MYYVYIMTNKTNSVVYVGVTNDLQRRVNEHKNGDIPGFTQRYHLHKLVYFEHYSNADEAISREKQIKGYSRTKKNELISKQNPQLGDLSENLIKKRN